MLTCNGAVFSEGHVSVGLGVQVWFGQTKVHTVNNILLHLRRAAHQEVFRFNVPAM